MCHYEITFLDAIGYFLMIVFGAWKFLELTDSLIERFK